MTARDERDRRALAAVAGQFFVNGAMTASFIARAPQFRDRLGVSVAGYGVLMTLSAIAGLTGSVLAGRIVHAASTRRVLRAGAVVLVGGLLVMGAATTPVVWLVGMWAYAFCDTLVDVSMNLQGSWLSARRRAPVMNRLHGLWSLGFLTGGAGALAANAAGWSTFRHLLAVAVVASGALVVVARHLLAVDEDGHADVPAATTGHPVTSERGRGAAVALLVVAGMFAVVTEVTGGDWAPFRLTDDFAGSGALGSAAFVAFTVGMSVLRFSGDALQLRFGRRAVRRGAITTAAAGFAVATLVPEPAVAIAGFGLVGAGVATFLPGLYDDAARLPGRRGAGLGALTGGLRVAFLCAPVAIGALAGTRLSVGAALALVSFPALAVVAVSTECTDRLTGANATDARALQPDAAAPVVSPSA